MTSAGYSVVPIMIGCSIRSVRLTERLLQRGINALPIIHPAVPMKAARLRILHHLQAYPGADPQHHRDHRRGACGNRQEAVPGRARDPCSRRAVKRRLRLRLLLRRLRQTVIFAFSFGGTSVVRTAVRIKNSKASLVIGPVIYADLFDPASVVPHGAGDLCK